MPWIRVDDHFDEHPKLAAAGPLAWALWLAGLAYCNRNLTDGFIPWTVAGSLVSWDFLDPEGPVRVYIGSAERVSEEGLVTSEYVIFLLVEAGLWRAVKGGYLVHDYDEYQPTKAVITSERAKKAAAGQAGGIATATARARASAVANRMAPAVAESKPVPKPVPVPNISHSTTKEGAREIDDGRVDLEAFLVITRRAPTVRQRKLLDDILDRRDLTGPAWAADMMYRHPHDPIGAVIEADKEWRAERIAEAQAAEVPKPKPRRSPGLPQTTREIMAEMALLQREAPV